MPTTNSQNLENSILATLIANNDGWDHVCMLSEQDFGDAFARELFKTISEKANSGKPYDVVEMLYVYPQRREAITSLMTSAHGTVATLPHRIKTLKEASAMRKLVVAAQNIIQIAAGPETAEEVLAKANNLIAAVSCEVREDATVKISSIMPGWLDSVEEKFASGQHINGLATGFDDFDNKSTGLYGGDVMIIAGRPSMGKTALATNIAENVASTGIPVQLYSLEMSNNQLMDRVMSSQSRVDITRLRSPVKLDDEDWPRITRATTQVKNMALYVDDTPGLNLSELRSRANKSKRTRNIGLIIIDYLQLMSGPGDNRVNIIGDISRGIKLIAKELDIPVIVLSQLSRKVEARVNKRPLQSDLRESGSIEQDADIVSFVYRDDYYNSNSDNPGTAEWIIAKQRMGPTGTVKLTFSGQYSRFDSYAGEWIEKKPTSIGNPYTDRRSG